MEMFLKTFEIIFDHIFEKERLGEKDRGERKRWMDRHTEPSGEWTDGQTDRLISGRYVIINTNMDYTLQCCFLFLILSNISLIL